MSSAPMDRRAGVRAAKPSTAESASDRAVVTAGSLWVTGYPSAIRSSPLSAEAKKFVQFALSQQGQELLLLPAISLGF